jgi:hypothetical protein
MGLEPEEKILKEIRRRAFQNYDDVQQDRKRLDSIRFTLKALHEVTGLSHAELRNIADEVSISFGACSKGFFSIRNQLMITGSGLGVLIFLVGVMGWLLF